ncbi:MAG: hypothetical protein U0263_03750 [Polyangiaceae bacterium]
MRKRVAENVSEVKLTRLPAERLERLAVVGSVCCSSCCCCCCCLHAVGGLMGAAMGSAWAVAPAAGDAEAPKAAARDGAAVTVAVHWTIVVALSVVTFVIASLVDVHDGIWIGLAAVVIGLPAFQLTAFLLGLLLAPAFPVPDKLGSLKALGKIFVLSVIGSIIGGVLLAVGLVMLL